MKDPKEREAVPAAITALLAVGAVVLMCLTPWGIEVNEMLKQGMDIPFDVLPLVWAWPLRGE